MWNLKQKTCIEGSRCSLLLLLMLFADLLVKASPYRHTAVLPAVPHYQTVMNPAKDRINTVQVPDPVILDVQIGRDANQYILLRSKNQFRDTIAVPADADWFSISFSLLDQYKEANALFYLIDPLMEDYQAMPMSGEINLSEIPAGHYHLSVLVQLDSRYPPKKVTWHLHKQATFMETGLFYLLISLFIVGLTAFILYEKSKKLRSERQLRNQISRDLHDEVGGLLTGISMQTQLLLMQKEETFGREKSLMSISAYSREAIQMMDDIIWAIDLRNNHRGSLGDRMKFFANQMIPKPSMSACYEMDHHNERKIPQPIRQNLYLIFKEALHNACKHGKKGPVHISLCIRANAVTMAIRNQSADAEQVVSSSEKRQGQGQLNMRVRADQIGASISSGKIGQEYVVEVVTPLRRHFLHFLYQSNGS